MMCTDVTEAPTRVSPKYLYDDKSRRAAVLRRRAGSVPIGKSGRAMYIGGVGKSATGCQ